jgi:hypothetical protein
LEDVGTLKILYWIFIFIALFFILNHNKDAVKISTPKIILNKNSSKSAVFFYKKIYKDMKRTYIKYLLLCIALLIITEATKKLLHLDKLIYNSLAEKISSSQIESFFELQDKWQWVSWVFVPIYILIKTTIIASIIYIGTFFFSRIPITFKQLWEIVIKAEFIFLLIPVAKIIWFSFFQTDYILEDIQYFYPFSLLNVVGYQGLEPWFIYPFQALNLFEMAYVIYLGYQLGDLTKTNVDNGLKILVYSYIPALVLWIAVIMFFTLNYS